MSSNVWMIDFRASAKENLPAKLERLLAAAGLAQTIKARDLVAIKLHFGELGNTAFVKPLFIRRIVSVIKSLQGAPFLTDANTLYAGTRGNAADHLTTAIQNGFAYAVVEAPLVIADGLRGKSETAVPIQQKRFETVYIGSEIVEADALVSVAHFKGHELTGFGGTIKNIGMGSASRKGKLAQHSTVSPKIQRKRCIGCGDCVAHCAQGALSLEGKKAVMDAGRCVGCGECILICPEGAIQVNWNQAVPVLMENMVEYAYGTLLNKQGKSLFINFITDVSPACDCYGHNDAPIVRNIGILAATDPVAIDQASADLVNQEAGLPGSCLTTHLAPGEDKFKGIYPEVDWRHQLTYAQSLGLGTCDYQLIRM